ncbi:MAG: phosphoribosylamine--glycine ligase [Sporocytophaga sp.]|uniref:phosphoribosylamine--glycine ligase n=1 Tax=Sporocytophaga sp. TaxID=2231183 RepID=UPI001B11EDDE|nr:phosphoribosylamine--glycine ligase [Sporocytophaga sp.]MBO9700044.1 phosphoribosylamine--glycine ligase [Sporocytophaga sp.]
MNILIVGSGGREHTFAWKIKQSPLCKKLFVAPGNGGTEGIATNVPLQVTEFEKLGKFSVENQIDLVLVGPEVPLVEGIVDYFKSTDSLKQIPVIGPSKDGAMLEGSKDFSKNFMVKYGIPTAASKTFTANELKLGLEYIETQSLPIVLKADGLAAGKGVIIAQSKDEAKTALREMLEDKKFGEASAKVVIEQYLDGIELSVFTISDGSTYKILPEAKDYKRIGEKDTGLNTGGMGAVSPVPFADKAFMDKVEKKVIIPTINGLKAEGIDYVGFIFFGLMNVKGEPYVIEYNARMGDPETEVVIPRIKNDFLEVLVKVADKKLDEVNLEVSDQTATTVMLVAGGYPEDYEKGKVISGLENVGEVLAFHAGTALKDNKLITNGGRVIALTGLGQDIQGALLKSNKAAENVIWEKRYYRRDIGLDLLALIEK